MNSCEFVQQLEIYNQEVLSRMEADDHGSKVKLSDYAGKKIVVLFFYPKADTPG
jgi:peroxiredoxin